MDMVCVARDLFPFHAVCKVIRRLDNPMVDSHSANMDYASLSDLYHRSVPDDIDGSGCCHHTDGHILVDGQRKK